MACFFNCILHSLLSKRCISSLGFRLLVWNGGEGGELCHAIKVYIIFFKENEEVIEESRDGEVNPEMEVRAS